MEVPQQCSFIYSVLLFSLIDIESIDSIYAFLHFLSFWDKKETNMTVHHQHVKVSTSPQNKRKQENDGQNHARIFDRSVNTMPSLNEPQNGG